MTIASKLRMYEGVSVILCVCNISRCKAIANEPFTAKDRVIK